MTTRRDFLSRTGLITAGSIIAPNIFAASSSIESKQTKPSNTANTDASPNTAQQAWMDLGRGMFIHYGINTYYDTEWSDGSLDPIKVNPTELDTDQWCRVAKAAGMKYIVFITKHHDGFCLWPTKETTYSIENTPFKRDFLAEAINSAHKYGLKVGLYYSLWDRHEKLHDTNEYAYVEFMKRQIKELLTNYGEIVELWFDGFWKKQASGWEKQITDDTGEKVIGTGRSAEREENFITSWRMEGAFRWQMDHLYQYIKSLQPNCMVMNNSTTAYTGVPLHPVDVRSGEKFKTYNPNDRKVWNWMGKDIYLPMQIETTMSVKGDAKFPSGNWFWHEWDHSVMTKEQILNYYDVASRMKANILINCGPMGNGKLRPEDEKALSEII